MTQSKADPCLCKKKESGSVQDSLIVQVGDILIGGKGEKVDMVNEIVNENSPTNDLGEVRWYMGCAVDRY